jgi:uncharacterized membrane protein
MADYRAILSEEEKKLLVSLVKSTEENTSCEIKIHINDFCKGDALAKAIELITKLGLDRTKKRTGIILYLAVKDKKFAIAGDVGIHKILPDNTWHELKDEAIAFFKDEKYVEGFSHCLLKLAKVVEVKFPENKNDNENEISDDISFE